MSSQGETVNPEEFIDEEDGETNEWMESCSNCQGKMTLIYDNSEEPEHKKIGILLKMISTEIWECKHCWTQRHIRNEVPEE